MANKIGRPTIYTLELAQEICSTVASQGKGLPRLCKENPHWPNQDTIHDWRNKNKIFSDMYTKAKLCQVETLVDEILDIADDTEKDTKENEDGKLVCNNEYVNRSRLRVEARKWIAAKLAPRVYGDKTIMDGSLGIIAQESALKELE